MQQQLSNSNDQGQSKGYVIPQPEQKGAKALTESLFASAQGESIVRVHVRIR